MVAFRKNRIISLKLLGKAIRILFGVLFGPGNWAFINLVELFLGS